MSAQNASTVQGLDLRPHARLRRAIPSLRMAVAGALVWAAVCAGSAFLNLAHWATASHVGAIVLLFGIGAALAFPPALFLARLAAGEALPSQRFAAAFLALITTTVGVTVLLFALQYRAYYAHWHAETSSIVSGLQFFFTILGASYQFAVQGLRLYLPYGLAAGFALSYWMATRR